MKKVVKKQLKEDEFVTTVNKIIDFATRRKKELIAGAAAVVVIILVVIGIRIVKAQQIKRESVLLSRIFQLSSEVMDEPDKLTELEALAGNGKFARIATIQLASYWYEKKDFVKAQDLLEKFPAKSKDLFYYQAQDLLGQVYMKQEKYDEALAVYEKILDNPEEYSLDVVYFHMAELFEKKGDTEKALDYYKKIQDEFSQSYYAYDAASEIRKLEGKK